MSSRRLKISARQSELAKLQAYQVGAALEARYPDLQVEYAFRESLGDQNQNDPLWKMPEKGVFTEDFKLDLVENKTDLVVHSWKDLPTEKSEHTVIAATLPRADQRDLILFKKKSRGQRELTIFSSSPRRAHNLTPFFKWALPFAFEELQFQSVRGNMATRIRKWLENDNVDGLIVAKAAIDRLVSGPSGETRQFLQKVMSENLWMAAPLTANPNAAAQGALAIEINRSRTDLVEILKGINCQDSFTAAQAERDLLKSYGGGCHLALGMSCLIRPYGRVQIIRGLTPAGERVESTQLLSSKRLPEGVVRTRLKFAANRKMLPPVSAEGFEALYVSKAEAWNVQMPYHGLVWTSGLETWKKLAKSGVWVNGSNESLGENEQTRVEGYFATPLKWARLSHDQAAGHGSESVPQGDKKPLSGYSIDLKLESDKVPENAAFVWMSPLEFDLAVQKFPQVRSALHICGPGRTFEALKKRLGSDQNIYIEIPSYT